jgi:hypothetical protein
MTIKQFGKIFVLSLFLVFFAPKVSLAQSTILPTPGFPEIFRSLEARSDFLSILFITLSLIALLASFLGKALNDLFIFFYKKPKKKWGFVYNSLTKQKIKNVIVYLYKQKNGKFFLVEKQKSGNNGSFGFDIPAGEYRLSFYLKSYEFPSKIITESTDGDIEGVYHGEKITIASEDNRPRINAPLDPVPYYEPSFEAKLDYYGRRAGVAFLLLGTFFSLYSLYYFPSTFRLSIIAIPATAWLLVLISVLQRAGGIKVISDKSGVPLDRISIELTSLDTNQSKTYLTDLTGRIKPKIPRGKYEVIIRRAKGLSKKIIISYQGDQSLGQIVIRI